MTRAWGALLVVAPALLAGRIARAQDCAPPDLRVAVPRDGATGVPLDATFRARYAPTAEYRGEPVLLSEEGGAAREVPAFYEIADTALVATPDVPLLPATSYVLEWPSLSDRDATIDGTSAVVRFVTGTGPDAGSPSLDGPLEIAWAAEKAHDDCVESAVERFVFDLFVGEARDDTGPGTLEALVFQTAGPAMEPGDPARLIDTAPMPAAGEALSVRLPRDESIGRVCMSVVARDLSGRISPGGEETCVVTRRPPFFGGCSAAGGHSDLVRMSMWVLVMVRRRRRGRRSGGFQPT